MKKYDLIVFDLDGTLINTIADLGEAVNHALALRGFPQHAPGEFPAMVGHGVRNLVKNALPGGLREDDALVDSVLADFTEWYSSHIDIHTRPYPGMAELLERLEEDGTLLAVASNKFQAGTEALVREFFGGRRFIAVCGNRPDAPLKPDPALVRSILAIAEQSRRTDGKSSDWQNHPVGRSSESGLSQKSLPPARPDAEPELRAVMVGDSATDILTARNGGIPAVAVTWGYRPESDLAGADFLARTPEELESLLRG